MRSAASVADDPAVEFVGLSCPRELVRRTTGPSGPSGSKDSSPLGLRSSLLALDEEASFLRPPPAGESSADMHAGGFDFRLRLEVPTIVADM